MFQKLGSYAGVALVATLAAVGTASEGQAAVLVTSSAGMNDLIDWGQLGGSFTAVPSPSSVVSNGGVGASVSSTGGPMERRDQGNGWAGNFAPGAHLLWTTTSGGPDITIDFSTPVFAAGAQIQADFFGAFTAEIMGNGGLLGTFTEPGNATSNGDNSAIFIGLRDSVADITSITFELTSASSHPNDFAIGNVSLQTVPSAVPLPAALPLLAGGVGVFGVFGRWRKKRSASTAPMAA